MVFSHLRQFPVSDLKDSVVLVVPDHMVRSDPVLMVRDAIRKVGGQQPELLGQMDFTEEIFVNSLVIACGHMANNSAIRRLYTARCCFVDTFFPGGDGHFVKSISDPFRHGRNCVVVGGSTDDGLVNALEAFKGIVDTCDGELGRVHTVDHNHELPETPRESDLQELIDKELNIWGTGWSASPFRGGGLRDYLWHYYLTDNPVWGKTIPAVLAGSIGPWRQERVDHPESYHCLFNLQSFIHLWDLIEDSPLYSDEDRKGAVTMFGDLLRHLSGLFYTTDEVNPEGEIRQNHTTFIGLNLAVGADYMRKRYGISEFDDSAIVAKRIFDGQADCYKPNDDGGVGYAWHVPQETLYYLLYKNDYRYIEDGHVDELCRMAAVTTDNMRSEGNYGDTGGYPAFGSRQWEGRLWPLMVSTWYHRDPEHLWMLNWLGEGKRPPLSQVVTGLYSGVDFTEDGFGLKGCEPRPPLDLLGISVIQLPEKVLSWVRKFHPEAYHPAPKKIYYDKLSMRSSFEDQDEYLLLEGLGTTCHGHEDSNAIIRMSWKNRAWLADGDYIRAAPKFHNSIVVSRDGVGELEPTGDGIVIPPLSSLNSRVEDDHFGLVQSEASGYNGIDWMRNLFWSKGRYMAVIDELRSYQEGEYHCRCMWRLVGDPGLDGRMTTIHQIGETLYLHNVDGAKQEIVPDLHEKSRWRSYPHADEVIKVLHQSSHSQLKQGEATTFLNLFTPWAEVTAERLGDRLIRVKDGDTVAVLGVGHNVIGGVEVSGIAYRLSVIDDGIEIQGVERVGQTELDSGSQLLTVGEQEVAEQLRNGLLGDRTWIGDPAEKPIHLQPSSKVYSWQTDLNVEITDLYVNKEAVLVGTVNGKVSLRDCGSGDERWSTHLDGSEIPTVVMLSDLVHNEGHAAIVGTSDSHLVVIDGNTGSQRWSRELKNMWSRGARVTGLAVSDLEGEGDYSILAATEGWYVNAFSQNGDTKWAEWFRYHAITDLIVADADGDGKSEVFVGTEYSTPLTVHNFDGSFRWSTFEEVGSEGNATTPRRGICLKHMVLIDLDSDGVEEIVYGTEDGWIFAVNPQEGEELWHLNIAGEVTGLVVHSNGIIATNEFGFVFSINYSGEVSWHHRVADWISHLASNETCVTIARDREHVSKLADDGNITYSYNVGNQINHLRGRDRFFICATVKGSLIRIDTE